MWSVTYIRWVHTYRFFDKVVRMKEMIMMMDENGSAVVVYVGLKLHFDIPINIVRDSMWLV